jgi:general secretion pathway protein H
MRREAGFSLIEMMVVLAIVSLAAGLVVVSAPGPSGQLANETDRLIRSLVAARDLALIENRNVMVEVSETGYATRVASRLGPAREVEITLWNERTTVAAGDGRLPAVVVFDPVGLAEPASFTLFNEGAKDGVAIAPSGRIGRLGGAAP